MSHIDDRITFMRTWHLLPQHICPLIQSTQTNFFSESHPPHVPQWIPPHERARSVSLTTSGMYLGSATAMWALPAVAAALGAGALFTVRGVCQLWHCQNSTA